MLPVLFMLCTFHLLHGSNIYVHRYKNMIFQLQPPLHQLPPPPPAPLPPLASLSASPLLSPRPCCGQPPLGPPPPLHLPHLRQSEVGTHGGEGAQFFHYTDSFHLPKSYSLHVCASVLVTSLHLSLLSHVSTFLNFWHSFPFMYSWQQHSACSGTRGWTD